jgi:putative transposase
MVRYRRNFLPGGTFFFTVTLDDRRSSALIDHIGLLGAAFRGTRNLRPFAIDAIVILPDHLHAIWTLPEGDADFSDRWRRIKGAFTRGVVATGVSVPHDHRGEYALWQRRFWEHTVRNERDFERCVDYIHFYPVKHGLVSSPVAWPFPHCTDIFERVCCLAIGAEMAAQTMPPISASGPGSPGFRFAPSRLRSNATHPPLFSVWSYTSRATWFSRSLSMGPDST